MAIDPLYLLSGSGPEANPVSSTNPVPVTGSGTAGTPASGVTTTQGLGYTGTSTLTRAANTTQYTANDVVGGALTIASVGPTTGEIFVTGVRITMNITALPAAMTTFSLYVYNATPPSAIADNSPFTFASGDRASFLTRITGLTATLLGTGSSSVFASLENINYQFKITAGANLFAYLVTDGAFTPAANSETYSIIVKSVAV